jgi:membrane protease YdiL (CAAX protease family)
LPGGSLELLAVCGENLAIFGIIFAVGALFGRPRLSELFLRRLRWMDWAWGAMWSIGLRIGLMVAMLTVVGIVYLVQGGGELDVNNFRPKIESLIDPKALADPVYLILSMTVVSMITAGLREELWRAGCMSAIVSFFPDSWRTDRPDIREWKNWRSHRAHWVACFVATVIFGLGHWPQGLPGMLLTGTLGFGLGLVMIYHRSFWVAALAHGMLDASTFGFLGLLQWIFPDLLKQLFSK